MVLGGIVEENWLGIMVLSQIRLNVCSVLKFEIGKFFTGHNKKCQKDVARIVSTISANKVERPFLSFQLQLPPISSIKLLMLVGLRQKSST